MKTEWKNVCRIPGCLLFILTVVPQVTVFLVEADAQPETDWMSTHKGKLVFHLHVEVTNPDGSLAKDCNVIARAGDSPLAVEPEAGLFRIDLSPDDVKDFHSFRILAASSDGNMMAHELVAENQVRQLARDGIKLQLKPARTVEVSVFHEHNPVPFANVQVWSVGIHPPARTDEQGMARFKLPVDAEIHSILAWTEKRMIAGMEPRNMSRRFSLSREFRLDLDHCRSVLLRVFDHEGNPLQNVPLDVHYSSPPPERQRLPFEHLGKVVTDEHGEATFKWMPANATVNRFYALPDHQKWQFLEAKQEADGEYRVRIQPLGRLPRKKIAGQLDLPPGERGGFLLSLSTFQGEWEHRGDVQQCYVDDQGHFEAEVLHGSTYVAFINDADWGSTFWDGILYDPGSDSVQLPEIEFVRNVPIHVAVTQGPEKEPIPNLFVRFANRHRYSWEDKDGTANGNEERRWWARTNENGIAITQSAPGEVRVSVYESDWRKQEFAQARPGETTLVELHRSTVGSQPVAGAIRFENRHQGNLEGAKVVAYAADGESSGKAETVTDARGAFALNLPGTSVAYLIFSADERFSATGIVPTTGEIRADLNPCVSYRGRVVNQSDRPFENCSVNAEAIIQFQRGEMGLGSSFTAKKFHTTTNVDGYFEFVDCLPANIRIKCSLVTNDNKTHRLGTIFLETGEERELQTLTVNDSVSPTVNLTPLNQRFALRVNDARLINAHLLVVVHRQSENVEDFIAANCLNYRKNENIGRYLIIPIDETRAKSRMDSDFMLKHDWAIPEENGVMLSAIGPDGMELGRMSVDVIDDNAPDEVSEFLARHVPVQKDARAEFEKALAEARQTDRKVWARICQTRCGPCFKLSRWIDQNRAMLEKEFVLYKVDNVNEKNGMEIYKRIMPESGHHGVPFHAVFDSRGNKLIDSRNALGNIGFPGSRYESRKHLRKMLTTDLKHLSLNEVDQIIDSLD